MPLSKKQRLALLSGKTAVLGVCLYITMRKFIQVLVNRLPLPDQMHLLNLIKAKKISSPSRSGLIFKEQLMLGELVPFLDHSYNVDQNSKFMLIQHRAVSKSSNCQYPAISMQRLFAIKLPNSSLKCIIDLHSPLAFDPYLLQQVQKPSFKSKTQSLISISFGSGLSSINPTGLQGIRFFQPVLLVGDFIFNPETGILRCFSARFLGHQHKESLSQYLGNTKFKRLLMVIFFEVAVLQFARELIICLKTLKSLLSEVEAKLADGRDYTCVKCNSAKVSQLYLPCYHLAHCQNCSDTEHRCPICEKPIQSKKQLYL